MDRLADPESSRVILVGGARYEALAPLPTVANNLTALRELFTDPQLWGLPDRNCVTVLDPPTPLSVNSAIRDVSTTVRPEGLLLFYFAGHGLIDPRTGGLHLAVQQTDREAVYATAMPYEWVRREFLDAPAGQRVVILDCCYSGRAIAGMGPATMADEVEIDLACVLVAASANRAALAPPDEPYTSFTGAVIELLRAGIPGGPDLIDLGAVYDHVVSVQRSLGRPRPELRARNGGERIPLTRNRAAAPHSDATDHSPAGSAALVPGLVLTGTPRLPDPELAGALVALLAYDPLVGALGVRLGRPLDRPAAEVLGARTASALAPAGVYDGGPVRDSFVVVVRPRSDAPTVPSYRAIDELHGTAPPTTDPRLLDGAWVFLGYVGWRPGQLEVELAQGAFEVSHRSMGDWLAHTRGD